MEKKNNEPTKYEILGISKNATLRQTKDAYFDKINTLFQKIKTDTNETLDLDTFSNLYMDSFFDLYGAYIEISDTTKREGYNYRTFGDRLILSRRSPLYKDLYEGNNNYTEAEDMEMLKWLMKCINKITYFYNNFKQDEYNENVFHTSSIIHGMISIGKAIEDKLNEASIYNYSFDDIPCKCLIFNDFLIKRENRKRHWEQSKFNDPAYKVKRKELLASKNIK